MKRDEIDSTPVESAHVEAAYVENGADLLSYFGRRVEIAADAADLLSETFVVAWRRRARMPAEPTEARMWLFGVARHVLANSRRSSVRRRAVADRLRAHLEAQPADAASAEVLDIRAALSRLPRDQSELVRLVQWDGFTVPEAATILGVSESTARGRYQRARARLREALSDHAPLITAP